MNSIAYAAGETLEGKKITRINAYQDYAVIYYSPASSHSQTECLDSTSRAIINFEDDSKTRKEMYALAISAASSGKKVNIAVNHCYGDHPEIYRLDVFY